MLQRWLPSLVWVKDYNRSALISDLMAAIIVTIMLIPQSLAYALLAGLPPEMGLYASILPLVAYAQPLVRWLNTVPSITRLPRLRWP